MRKAFRLARNRQTLLGMAERVTLLLLLLLLGPGAIFSAFFPGEERPHGRETSAQNADAEFDYGPDLGAGIGPFCSTGSIINQPASIEEVKGMYGWGSGTEKLLANLQLGSVWEISCVSMQR